MKIVTYKGSQIEPLIPLIARLRIEIFKEYPFNYDGNMKDELRYLHKFSQTEDGIVIAAMDGDEIVGISSGFPLSKDQVGLAQKLQSEGADVNTFYCGGETLLKPKYRGQGIGRQLFDARDSEAKKLGCYENMIVFTSEKVLNDPSAPKEYYPQNKLWESRGYHQTPQYNFSPSYKEIGEDKESPKPMASWVKKL